MSNCPGRDGSFLAFVNRTTIFYRALQKERRAERVIYETHRRDMSCLSCRWRGLATARFVWPTVLREQTLTNASRFYAHSNLPTPSDFENHSEDRDPSAKGRWTTAPVAYSSIAASTFTYQLSHLRQILSSGQNTFFSLNSNY